MLSASRSPAAEQCLILTQQGQLQGRRTHRSAGLGAAQVGEVGPVVCPSPESPAHGCAHGQQPDDDLAGVQGPWSGLPDGGILVGLSGRRIISQSCVPGLPLSVAPFLAVTRRCCVLSSA